VNRIFLIVGVAVDEYALTLATDYYFRNMQNYQLQRYTIQSTMKMKK